MEFILGMILGLDKLVDAFAKAIEAGRVAEMFEKVANGDHFQGRGITLAFELVLLFEQQHKLLPPPTDADSLYGPLKEHISILVRIAKSEFWDHGVDHLWELYYVRVLRHLEELDQKVSEPKRTYAEEQHQRLEAERLEEEERRRVAFAERPLVARRSWADVVSGR